MAPDDEPRAPATRCCWPPDGWLGMLSALSPRPTRSSARCAVDRLRRNPSAT